MPSMETPNSAGQPPALLLFVLEVEMTRDHQDIQYVRGSLTAMLDANNAHRTNACHSPVASIIKEGQRIFWLPNCGRFNCWKHGDQNRVAEQKVITGAALKLRTSGAMLYLITFDLNSAICRDTSLIQQVMAWPDLINRFLKSYKDKAGRSDRQLDYYLVIELKKDKTVHAHMLSTWLPEPRPSPTKRYPNQLADDWLSQTAEKRTLKVHILQVKDTDKDIERVVSYISKDLGKLSQKLGGKIGNPVSPSKRRLPFNTVRCGGFFKRVKAANHAASREYLDTLIERHQPISIYSTKQVTKSVFPGRKPTTQAQPVVLTKRCHHCDAELPLTTTFWQCDRTKPNGFHSWCKRCRQQYDHRRDTVRDKEQKRKLARQVERLNRRALSVGVHGVLPAETGTRKVDAQHGRCHWCAAKLGQDYRVGYKKPLTLGGQNTPDNVVVTCPMCAHDHYRTPTQRLYALAAQGVFHPETPADARVQLALWPGDVGMAA